MVILDATVDEQGRVQDLIVMRSASKLLDKAAMAAVRQWRYEPLLFHGQPSRFRLTVTVSFSIDR
jgi:protein TonB